MVGIIGAGISGLSLAYFLQEQEIPYVLLEASDSAGGYIRSIQKEGYKLELGPNSILADENILSFLKELQLEDQLLPANNVSKNRYIFRQGKYRKLPSSPPKLLFNSFFSFSAKMAIYKEKKKPVESHENETLSGFFTRRFNEEIVEYALDPFVSGIYAGDSKELLIKKTFPKLLEYEQEYGSVIRGLIKNKGTQRKQSYSFREGMEMLPQTIAKKLHHVKYNSPVQEVIREGNDFLIKSKENTYQVQKLVVTTPALPTKKYLKKAYPMLSDSLGQINYPTMIAVHSAYKRHQVEHPLDGFGGLNPKKEDLFTAGSIWSSSVFADRCPENHVLFTSFVGGSQYTGNTNHTELVTLGKVHQELAQNYHIAGVPVFQHYHKIAQAIPQYDKNILEAHTLADSLESDELYVCANWKDGVSISDCIQKAQKLAQKLASKQQAFAIGS